MGFIDRFRQAQEEGIHADWNVLEQAGQLQAIAEQSFEKPQVLFKHSTRCGMSSMAKQQLEHDWNFDRDDFDMYYLDLIAHRDVSNQIADQFGITHQSPQLIIVHQGKAVYDTSHHAISATRLRTALDSL